MTLRALPAFARFLLAALAVLWTVAAAWFLAGLSGEQRWPALALVLAGAALAVVACRSGRRAAKRDAEARLRLFQTAVEGSGDGIAIRDAAMRPLYANAAYVRILGISQEDFLHGDLLRFCSEATGEFLRTVVFAALESCGRWRGEMLFQRPGGPVSTLWVSIDSLRDAEGRITHFVGLFHDATAHQSDREALQRSEARLRSVLDATSDGVFDHNLESGETFFSDSYYRLLGFEPGRIDDAPVFWGSRIHPEDKPGVLEALRRHLEGRTKVYRAEFRIRDSQDSWRWVLSRGSVMGRGADGQPLRLVGTHSDITETKRAQAVLRSAQEELEQRVRERTRELSEANAQVRMLTRKLLEVQEAERRRIARDLHDNVAQNLTSLKIMLESLFREASLKGPESRDKAALVSRTLQDTVGAVRELAYDLRPPSLDQLGLVRAVAQYCEDFGRVTGIAVDFFSAGMENVQLEGNAEVNLFRIVQEGLTNVSRHSGSNVARVRLLASHPSILLRVEDDGRGFDPDAALALAEGESRMGLRSMTERARILGGELRIVSSPGKGARLVVEIPCVGRSDGDAQTDSHC